MAKKRKITGDLAKTLKRIKNKKDDETHEFDPREQVEGIERRLEASGIDSEKVSDNRPLHKKLLNLPEGQNILFDYFEIMKRPQSAMFGALNSIIGEDDKNIGEALLDGIRGKETTKFKDVLHTAGMEESESIFGVDDALGMAGDIMLDPLNYVMPGSSALASNAKELKTAMDNVDKLEKAIALADKGEDFVEGISSIKAAKETLGEQLEEAIKLKDALKAKEAVLSPRDLTVKQLIHNKLGSGFKGMFVRADSGVEKFLGWLDKKNLEGALQEGLKEHQVSSMLQSYTNMKDSLKRSFNMRALLPEGFYNTYRRIRGRQAYTEGELKKKIGSMIDANDKSFDKLLKAILDKGNANISEERLEGLVNIIYEHNIIDSEGAVNLSNIRLHNKDVPIMKILTGKHRMMDTGFTEKDKDAIETFVQSMMPNWYNNNVLGDKSLTSGMFIKGSEGEFTDATWRIARPEWLDTKTNQTFIKELKELDSLEGPEKIREFLNVQHGMDLDNEDINNMSELFKAKDELKRLEERLARGETTILSKDSEVYSKYVESARKYRSILDEYHDALGALDKEGLSDKEFARLYDIFLEKESALLKYERINPELLKTYKSGQLDLNQVINSTKIRIREMEKAADTEALEMLNIFLNSEKGLGNINLGLGLNSRTVRDIEFLVNEVFDELNETTAGIHYMMTEISDFVSETFNTAYFEDVFTENYFRHTVTEEWLEKSSFRKVDRTVLQKNYDKAQQASDLIGNTSEYKGRRWEDAAALANDQVKEYIDYQLATGMVKEDSGFAEALKDSTRYKMFETDAKMSMMDHIVSATKTTADAQVYRHVLESLFIVPEEDLLEQGVKKTNLIITMDQAKDIEVPRGFVAVESRDLANKVNDLKKYFRLKSEDEKEFTEKFKATLNAWLNETKGKKIFIDKNIERMIGRMTNKVEQGSFLSFMDGLNRVFKKFKLLSPGFVFRSSVGSYSNMWLAGVDAKDIAKYSGESFKDFKLAKEISEKVQKGLEVSKSEFEKLKIYNEFMQEGFDYVENKVQDLDDLADTFGRAAKRAEDKVPKTVLQKLKAPKDAIDKFANFNLTKNRQITTFQRFALFKYAKENPEWLKENGYMDAGEAVRRVLYDYMDLSVVEQDAMKRLIPFYTFTKKNLGFQFQNMGKNISRYHDLIKTYDSLWGALDLDEDEQDQYKKESFWVPIPALTKDGKYSAIKTSLPVGSLGQFLSNPVQRTTASGAPLIRAPFELAMNKQGFSGMPISEFKGQKGYQIPELTRKQEYALSQFGLDVPASGAMDLFRTGRNVASGEIDSFGEALQSGLGRSLISQGDVQKTSERKAYDRLDDMQDLLRYYKQEGIDIMTLSEINNREKFNSIEGRIRRLREIRNRK